MKRLHAAVLALVLLLTACGQSAQAAWQEQYDLGTKYLEDGNYKEAILAFTAAIEIDPKQAPAYVGRGDAYVGAAETAQDPETAEAAYENALADYEKAVELGDEQAGKKAEDARTHLKRIEDDRGARELLQPLYARFAADDLDGAKALMRQETYKAMSAALTDGYLYYEEGGAAGLAVYPNDFYYYGAWENGRRSGHGLWLRAVYAADSSEESYLYDGEWADDAPNGAGTILRVRNQEKIEMEPGYTTSVRTEVTGSFANWLYHGEIHEVWYMNDGETHIWTPITAVDGIYQEAPELYRPNTHLREGEYIVAVDQNNESTDLWNGGAVNEVRKT